MKTKILLLLLVTHLVAGAVGFAAGIYTLPILIAPPAPTDSEIIAMSSAAEYSAEFSRDRKDSDSFHWGEGKVSISSEFITLKGTLAPGPDYKLYLSPEFVETEVDFNRLKASMILVGDIKTFENFTVKVPQNIDFAKHNSLVVWCETFGEFITSAQYR